MFKQVKFITCDISAVEHKDLIAIANVLQPGAIIEVYYIETGYYCGRVEMLWVDALKHGIVATKDDLLMAEADDIFDLLEKTIIHRYVERLTDCKQTG